MSEKIEDEINKIIDSLTNLKELVRNKKNTTYKVGRFSVTDLPSINNDVYRIKSGGKTNKFYKLSKKNKNKTRTKIKQKKKNIINY